MSSESSSHDSVVDELFYKYNLIDDEGYLVGTNHPDLIRFYKRLDALAQKHIKLTKEEEEEGEEMLFVHNEYNKEVQKYLLSEQQEKSKTESDDDTYEDEGDEDEEEEDSFESDESDVSDESL